MALARQALVWQLMMAVMMVPTAWPWVRAARRLAPAGSLAPGVSFGVGYFAAWAPFSLLLAGLQLGLARQLAWSPAWRSGVLLAAGLYQFLPLKRACLRHCRNPLTAFLGRWDNRPTALARLGGEHGLVCLGCCWALMATALVLGMMNWLWMAVLAAAVFAEQTLPRAAWVRPVLGAGLLAAGGLASFHSSWWH